jgi:hypothetical protein
MESSLRNVIDTVTILKERIVEATNEIVEKLGELENLATRKEAMVHIRKLVNQIISDLSIIGGFCSKQDKEIIQIWSRIVKHILALESGIS